MSMARGVVAACADPNTARGAACVGSAASTPQTRPTAIETNRVNENVDQSTAIACSRGTVVGASDTRIGQRPDREQEPAMPPSSEMTRLSVND